MLLRKDTRSHRALGKDERPISGGKCHPKCLVPATPHPRCNHLAASFPLSPFASELLLSPNWIEDECQNRLVLILFVANHSVSYTHRLLQRRRVEGEQGLKGARTGHPQNLGLCSKGQNAWVFLLVLQRGLLSGFLFLPLFFLWYFHIFLCHTLCKCFCKV